MGNLAKYNEVMCETLQIKEKDLDGLTYQGTEGWDSVGHMNLISALEDTFDIMFDTEDIINFDSYEKGKEILAKNYNIEF